MRKLFKYSFLVFALTLGVSTLAYANPRHDHDRDRKPKAYEAPEVDPTLAMGGFSLLAGTLTVLRAQRRK